MLWLTTLLREVWQVLHSHRWKFWKRSVQLTCILIYVHSFWYIHMHFDISIPRLKQCFQNLFFFSMTLQTSIEVWQVMPFFRKKKFSCISDPSVYPLHSFWYRYIHFDIKCYDLQHFSEKCDKCYTLTGGNSENGRYNLHAFWYMYIHFDIYTCILI